MYAENNTMTNINITLPSENLALIKELVQKLGGKFFESTGEQIEYISPPIAEKERIGRMLKGLRFRAGMTQKELAKAINVPQSHISQYEANIRPIPRKKAKELAKVLDSIASHFIERE